MTEINGRDAATNRRSKLDRRPSSIAEKNRAAGDLITHLNRQSWPNPGIVMTLQGDRADSRTIANKLLGDARQRHIKAMPDADL